MARIGEPQDLAARQREQMPAEQAAQAEQAKQAEQAEQEAAREKEAGEQKAEERKEKKKAAPATAAPIPQAKAARDRANRDKLAAFCNELASETNISEWSSRLERAYPELEFLTKRADGCWERKTELKSSVPFIIVKTGGELLVVPTPYAGALDTDGARYWYDVNGSGMNYRINSLPLARKNADTYELAEKGKAIRI